jgi:hypothetical protein
VHEASAEVIATGPAKRSDADFLAALNGIHVHGISVSVSVSWNADVSADVTQSSAACTDMAGTGGLYVSFASGAIRLGGSGGFAGSWRTRCPGPILESGLGGLSASLAAGALGQRQFTIGLRAAGAFTDDGYVVAPQGRLLVVLRRGTITQQVVTQPAS